MRLQWMVRVGARPIVAGLGLAVSIGLVACKDIPVKDGYYSCDPGVSGSCPSGMTCRWSSEAGEYRCFSGAPGDAYVPVCGNGTIDPGEECDGQSLGGQTCEGLGHPGGTLACSVICTYDRSGCDPVPTCGDGDIDPPAEQCDGSDLGGATCESLGYDQGTLACLDNCTYDTSGCTHHECGNGVLEGNEECDASDFGGQTCLTAAGRQEGQLQCTGQCFLDISNCHTCGDGVIEGSEQCDGTLLGGQTCVTRGHDGGQLACSVCQFDESGCYDCGDGACELTKGENLQLCVPDCGWTAVAGGYYHTCGLKADGTTWCWGDNGSGQLGIGPAVDQLVPVPVPSLTNLQMISAGSIGGDVGHTCFLMADGTVWCTGANVAGQLGDGTNTGRSTPVQVVGLSDAQYLGVGNHSCAIKTDGTAWCWGGNGAGQLGDGTTIASNTPVQVSGLATGVQIAAGSQHTCALRTDGTVWCWGLNDLGQLGDGTNTSRSTPAQVSGLADVCHISAAAAATCVAKCDGTAWCWGFNWAGGLGDGSGVNQSTPVQVSGLTNVVAVGSGTFHNCALRSDGTVWCWGRNNYYQMGIGVLGDQPTPVQVSGLTDVQAFGIGSWHGCGIKTDGTLWCWGRNRDGAIGNGTEGHATTPVQVTEPY